MRIKYWILAVCTLSLLAVSVAYAEDESQNRPLESQDPRLEKTISMDPSTLTLTDLAKKMTDSSGVAFSVDQNEKMWQVRQRKTDLVLKNLSAADLMRDLKKLLNYSWKTVGDSSAGSYEVYQSEVDLLREKRALQDAQNAKIQKKMDAFQNAISGYSQAGQLSSDQAAKIKDTDPYGYLMATWGPAKAMGNLLSSLPQNAISSVANGGKYTVSYRDLPPRMRQQVQQFYNGMKDFENQLNPKHSGDSTARQVNWDNMQLSVEPMPNAGSDPFTSSTISGMVHIKGDGNAEFPIMNPNSPFTQAMAGGLQQILDGQDPQDVAKSMGQKFPNLIKQISQQIPQTYTDERPPKNPSLLQNVIVPENYFKGNRLEVIKELSDLLQISVISDDYPEMNFSGMGSVSIPAGTMPVYKLLNQVSGQINRTWSLYGSAILLQDPDWVTKRTYDVPQAFIDALNKKIKDGTFGLQDMFQLASLTDDQLSNGFSSESKLRSVTSIMRFQHKTWSFIAGLSEDQKKQMENISGMPCAGLAQTQYDLLWKAFEDHLSLIDPNLVAQGSLRWISSTDNRNISIELTCGDGTDENPTRIFDESIWIPDLGKKDTPKDKTETRKAQ